MSTESILVGILLLAALAAAVTQPWWRPASRRLARATADPHCEYQALVAAIRDLDFDYRAGVVTEADYQPLRSDLVAQAVTVLQALDRRAPDVADLEAQIEDAVSALRATRQRAADAHPDGDRPTVCHACGQPVRAGSRFCPRCGAKLQQSCPDCGGPVEPEDCFCGSCGRPLVKEVTAV